MLKSPKKTKQTIYACWSHQKNQTNYICMLKSPKKTKQTIYACWSHQKNQTKRGEFPHPLFSLPQPFRSAERIGRWLQLRAGASHVAALVTESGCSEAKRECSREFGGFLVGFGWFGKFGKFGTFGKLRQFGLENFQQFKFCQFRQQTI